MDQTLQALSCHYAVPFRSTVTARAGCHTPSQQEMVAGDQPTISVEGTTSLGVSDLRAVPICQEVQVR